jgi:hypothetical protein
MVRRHLPGNAAFAFQCFTDDATGLNPAIAPRALPGNLTGWWNKLHLFREGVFDAGQRVIYFDLDTLITGGIEPLLRYGGEFALLRDFYRPDGYGSGVMLWRAGACHSLWARYEAAGRPMPAGGDQAWIETAWKGAELLQDIFPGFFASFKTDCRPLPPADARVICFHGEPKQDNCGAPWVREIWRPGGGAHIAPGSFGTQQEELLAHMRHAKSASHPWVEQAGAHERAIAIIGGGSSLDARDIRQDCDVFAVNGAARWCKENGVRFDAQVISGAQAEHAAFVSEGDVPCYCAATCHPHVRTCSKKRGSARCCGIPNR